MKIREYRSPGYQNFDLGGTGFDKVWNAALYNELYPDYDSFYAEILNFLRSKNIDRTSRILDSCCGSGFLTKDLYLDGFNIDFADKHPEFAQGFLSEINQKLNTDVRVIESVWSEYPENQMLAENTYDFIFNRGNSFIYASGDINKAFKADSVAARMRFKAALEGLYYVLFSTIILLNFTTESMLETQLLWRDNSKSFCSLGNDDSHLGGRPLYFFCSGRQWRAINTSGHALR